MIMKKKGKTLRLFHYTTQAGLRGIIENKSLWFTNILYLNDATEFEYTFKLLQDELENKFRNANKLRDLNDTLTFNFMKDIFDYDVFNFAGFYVFSFSTKLDDLSQWRAYSDDGGGYCIEFDFNKISKIANEKNWAIITCLYEDQKQREKINNIINKTYAVCKETEIIELIKTEYQAIPVTDLTGEEKTKLQKIRSDFIMQLLASAPKFKHPKFREEAELRMYIVAENSKGMSSKFRIGKTMLIPYQDIKLAESTEKMPIKRIIIGPSNHPKLSMIAVKHLLLANSVNCEVALSMIPYRAKL